MTVRTYNVHEQDQATLAEDLRFAGTASKHDADKVGWMPLGAYREATAQRRLVICTNNGDRVGFTLWQYKAGELKLYQVWVRADARLIVHGRSLVSHVEAIAATHGCYRLRAWVAEDLAANLFWAAIGFQNISWRWSPRKTSKRKHLLWIRSIVPGLPVTTPHAQQDAGPLLLPTSPKLQTTSQELMLGARRA